MKTPSSDLFFLIQSLSGSEQRYFRQYASRHQLGDQNKYEQLFDAILSMDDYDEEQLKSQLVDPKIVEYLAVAKRYLYQQILDSLHHFHEKHSIIEQAKKQFHQVRILFRKHLNDQAHKLLKKTEKIIEKHQLWSLESEFYELRRSLLRKQKALSLQHIEQSYQGYAKRLHLLQADNEYWYKSHQILGVHFEQVKAWKAEQRAELDQLAKELKACELPLQGSTTIACYKALATYHFMQGEIQQAAQYNQQLLNKFEQQPELIKLEREQYIATFNNYLIDNSILQNFEVMEQGIARLRQLAQQAIFKAIPQLEVRIFELTYSLQLNARVDQGAFEEALQLFPALKPSLQKQASQMSINYLLSIHYLMAYIYFANGQFEEALDHLQKLQDQAPRQVMQELQLAADRLLLLCHFELGNYRLLDNLLANIRRAHQKLKVKSPLEKVLFRYLKKLVNQPREGHARLFKNLKRALAGVKEEALRAWNYFDYDRWLEVKIAGQWRWTTKK